jgi:hypothetical protein
MKAQFTSPIKLPRDPADAVPVDGPLKQIDPDVRKANVVCVLVQAKDRDADNAVWVEGHGTWERSDDESQDGTWSGTVNRKGMKPGGESGMLEAGDGAGEVRGIAMAIVVKDGTVETVNEGTPEERKKLVPPSIETITWCVGVSVEDDTGQASEY